MAVLHNEYVEIPGSNARIRAHLVRPKDPPGGNQNVPIVIAWSDIFQLTEPHVRMARRLAGHGYAVLSPEIYSRFEPAGTVLDFDRDRQRALDASARVELSAVDAERRAVFDWARAQPFANGAKLGVCGWCFGGHLAFRAALDPEVRAAACFYPTGVHNGVLGAAQGTAATLERAREITGAVLIVWGRNDPHIPAEGRARIHRALDDAGVRAEVRAFDAEHAFMRDEGPRYDPAATDRAFDAMLALFRDYL